MFSDIISRVREKCPLVHNITNYVTVNDCANILLACGGSPIMADDSTEVEDITSICNSLVINIGTLNERTVEAMLKAGKKANELGHPIILDPVGAGASRFRTEVTLRLLREVKFTVIRGNISEIKMIYTGAANTKGVDADALDRVTEDNLMDTITHAKELSRQTGAIIAITGAIDIVADENKAYSITNGHPMMSRITGTGCMLTSVIGAFVAANPERSTEAVAAAVCSMGLCGEYANYMSEKNGTGTASFRAYLIDYMSHIDDSILKAGAKLEAK